MPAKTKNIGLPIHESYSPPERVRRGGVLQSREAYETVYRRSITDRDGFWAQTSIPRRHGEATRILSRPLEDHVACIRAADARRIAKEIVDHRMTRRRIINMGHTASSQMHDADFANEGDKGGSYSGIYGITTLPQNLGACRDCFRPPGRYDSTHTYLQMGQWP